MKAAQMTREDEIRSISQKYEMDKEKVRDILERGVRYADADKAALFACMTGKDIEEVLALSLIHISEPTRQAEISYAVFCLKKIFFNDTATTEIYTSSFVGSVRCV